MPSSKKTCVKLVIGCIGGESNSWLFKFVRMELKIFKQHQTTSGALLNKLPHVNHPHKPHQEAASTTKWRYPPMEHVSTHVLLLRFKALTLETSRHERPILRPWRDTGWAGWELRANISMGKDERWARVEHKIHQNPNHYLIKQKTGTMMNYSQHPLDKTNSMWMLAVWVICRDRVLGWASVIRHQGLGLNLKHCSPAVIHTEEFPARLQQEEFHQFNRIQELQ